MDNGGVNPRCLGIGCVATTAVAFVIALLGMAVVDPTELAVRYNRRTSSAAVAPAYDVGGRYWIGPFSYFIKFPAVAQTLEWSSRRGTVHELAGPPLVVRVALGQTATLHFAFQYILQANKVNELYRNYSGDQFSVSTGHKRFAIAQARSQVQDTASKFQLATFWENRSLIDKAFREDLTVRLQEFADVRDFQLIRIDLPSTIEDQVTLRQVQRQLAIKREFEQMATTIRANTTNMLADFARTVTIIENDARARASVLTKTAEAAATQSQITTEKLGLATVSNNINLTSSGRVQYQEAVAYQNLDNAQIMYGVQQAATIVRSASRAAAQQGTCNPDVGGAECMAGEDGFSQDTTDVSPELFAAAQGMVSGRSMPPL